MLITVNRYFAVAISFWFSLSALADTLIVQWPANPETNITNYVIYQIHQGKTNITQTTSTNYTASNCIPGHTYQWAVAAVNSDGLGSVPTGISYLLPAPEYVVLTAVVVECDSLAGPWRTNRVFVWTNSTSGGARLFRISRLGIWTPYSDTNIFPRSTNTNRVRRTNNIPLPPLPPMP